MDQASVDNYMNTLNIKRNKQRISKCICRCYEKESKKLGF